MCAVLVQAGCGETDEDVAYDLATLVTEARVISELRRLDFGVADTRSYLDEGWSRDESAADGTSFVWSTGESSSLRLFLAERRDVLLSFRCWTFQYFEAPPQQVTVEVNGATIATVALPAGPAEYRVRVPASAVEPGSNRVSFRYRWHRAPRDVIPGANDGRALAVAWDWLSVDNALLAGTPSVEDDTLTLPLHTRVQYLLMLPAESVLVIDQIAPVPARSEVAGMGFLVTVDTLKGRREDVYTVEETAPSSFLSSMLVNRSSLLSRSRCAGARVNWRAPVDEASRSSKGPSWIRGDGARADDEAPRHPPLCRGYVAGRSSRDLWL